MSMQQLIRTSCATLILAYGINLEAHAFNAGMLDQQQIRNYITNLVDTLVSDGGTLENTTARREIIESVYRGVTHVQSLSELFGYTPILRQDTTVEKQVIEGIREYSVRTAHEIAFSRTQNAAIAYRVKNHIEQAMRALYANSNSLIGGIFSPFAGNALTEKVNQLCNQFDTPYQTAPKMYPSNSCCICMNDFDATTMRVFLKPCGHDMCTQCAQDYFITRHNNRCPHCRQTVNVQELEHTLPSAPSFWH